jgi:hypothetical protein
VIDKLGYIVPCIPFFPTQGWKSVGISFGAMDILCSSLARCEARGSTDLEEL